MTLTRPSQTAFSSGELDPQLHAREDFQRHQTGLAICQGFLPMRQGGFTRAPGTIYRGTTRNNAVAIRVPFVFAQNDAVELEFSDQIMRVWRYGVLVMDGASPYELATPFTEADLPKIATVQDADVMYLADGRNPVQQLSRLALDNWTIAPADFESGPFRAQNLDKDLTIQCINPTIGASLDPWVASEVLTIGDSRQAGVRAYQFEGRRLSGTSDALANGDIGDIMPIHTGGTEVLTVSIGGTDYDVHWTFVADLTDSLGNIEIVFSDDYLEAAHVGTLFLIEPKDWLSVPYWVGSANLDVGSLVRFDGNIYEIIGPPSPNSKVNSGVNPPTHTVGTVRTDASRPVEYKHISTEKGIVRVLQVDSATEAVAQIVAQVPKPCFDDPTHLWSEGAWSARHGYPSTLALVQQRLFAAGQASDPRSISASELGAYRSFLPGSDATESFTYDIGGGGSRNAISWLAEGKRGIYIGSLGEVRRGHGGQGGDPIAPATFQVDLVSRIGSAPITPVSPFGWPIYISRDFARVLEVRYDFQQDDMNPLELSLPSQHLGAPGFRQIVWQSGTEEIGWLRRGDGSLACLIYDPTQDVLGWASVPVAGGVVEHLSVSPSADSAYDVVTLIVRRELGGQTVRCVEEMAINTAAQRGTAPMHTANHAFCGAVQTADPATDTFSVTHLAGQSVVAWTDEGGFDGLTVAQDGSVTLPLPVSHAIIGLADASHRARTLPLRAPAPDGDSRGRERSLRSGSAVIVDGAAGGYLRAAERVEGGDWYVGPRCALFDRGVLTSGTDVRRGVIATDLTSGTADEIAIQFEPDGAAPLTVTGIIPSIDETGA